MYFGENAMLIYELFALALLILTVLLVGVLPVFAVSLDYDEIE